MNKKAEEIIKEMKNEYAREWRRNHKDKVKEINDRYWLKKAKESGRC